MTMNPDDAKVWRGRSTESFADAARDAVRQAEDELGERAPKEYEITLGAMATPGSSLSDYIAFAKSGG
jgi:predicted hydrolase (HD superfamily)